MEKKLFLILGSSGFIGRKIYQYLKKTGLKTYGTFNKGSSSFIEPKDRIYFNLMENNFDNLTKIEDIKYAIFCHGISKINDHNLKQAYFINVTQTIKLLALFKRLKITPIYLSSSMVFDGTKIFPTEEEMLSPINSYGKQKAIVEEFIKNNFTNYLICRLTKVFGIEPEDQTIFSSWFNNLINNRKIITSTKIFISPIFVQDLIQILIDLIHNNCHGTFHIGGKNTMNIYEFAIFFSKILNFDSSYIKINYTNRLNLMNPYPKYNNLDYNKLKKILKIHFTPFEYSFKQIAKNSEKKSL